MRDIISHFKWRYNYYTRKLMNINLPKRKFYNKMNLLNLMEEEVTKRNEPKEIEYSYYDLLKNLF